VKSDTHVRIRATPREIWPWVAHPDGIMRWNRKLVAHEAPALEHLHRGSRFRVTYRMKKPVETWAEISEWNPPHHVALLYRDDPSRSRASGPRPGRLGSGGGARRGPGGRTRRGGRRAGKGGGAAWMSGLGRGGWASESVRLEADGDETRVVRALKIHAPSIPWPFRLLMGFFLRFGTPVEGTHLDRLKEQVEGGEPLA